MTSRLLFLRRKFEVASSCAPGSISRDQLFAGDATPPFATPENTPLKPHFDGPEIVERILDHVIVQWTNSNVNFTIRASDWLFVDARLQFLVESCESSERRADAKHILVLLLYCNKAALSFAKLWEDFKHEFGRWIKDSVANPAKLEFRMECGPEKSILQFTTAAGLRSWVLDVLCHPMILKTYRDLISELGEGECDIGVEYVKCIMERLHIYEVHHKSEARIDVLAWATYDGVCIVSNNYPKLRSQKWPEDVEAVTTARSGYILQLLLPQCVHFAVRELTLDIDSSSPFSICRPYSPGGSLKQQKRRSEVRKMDDSRSATAKETVNLELGLATEQRLLPVFVDYQLALAFYDILEKLEKAFAAFSQSAACKPPILDGSLVELLGQWQCIDYTPRYSFGLCRKQGKTLRY